jgi:hydrogenase expression/formation protein HypE
MTEHLLPVGKLDAEILRCLLADMPGDPSVIVGPGVGCDVAVLDTGAGDLLLAKTDPVTFATDAIGYYVVNVNANDIATSGGRPRWFLATALLPENSATEQMAADIFAQIADACSDLGVVAVGGHTEITWGLDRPIVVGQMLGQVARDRLVRPQRLQTGNAIIVTKLAPLEGTALIAREQPDRMRQVGFSEDDIQRCAAMLFHPGISVLPEAQVAVGAGRVTAMHDPTEGGIATGLWEMAEAAAVGLEIHHDAIPLLPEARRMCKALNLDPLGLIASGSLLIGCAADDAEAIIGALHAADIEAAVIGQATGKSAEVRLVTGAKSRPMPRYDQDELTRIL